jgi:hypothetical protein
MHNIGNQAHALHVPSIARFMSTACYDSGEVDVYFLFFFISENPYRDKNRIEIFILSKPSQKYLISGIYYVFV